MAAPPRLSPRAQDALVVAVALLDTWISSDGDHPLVVAGTVAASLALLLRRCLPGTVLLITLVPALTSYAVVVSLTALYTFASLSRSRARILAAAVAFTACYSVPWPLPPLHQFDGVNAAIDIAYSLALAAAPVFLGQLVQARRDLSLRLAEITEAREHERLLTAQSVLAKERAQLAREMHDVVSHQVSLIAVRAGALQVSVEDPAAKEAATTIRQLSVRTLDELRHMVSVLRAGDGRPADLTPQPTLAELAQLVAHSGIDAELTVELPDDPPLPVQRAVYRTVQEALTNVRKHAPGARATVRVRRDGDALLTTVTNTAATRPTLALPSARHGLIGLRQRADLLGGTLTTTRPRGTRRPRQSAASEV
ncbi:sensor histidine kinase [Streptomyces specialis]|uniref:sensor histidine kinase n=1 Tax=Streptomyces specialis TaxID=498367 RepID=UPI00073F3FA6|nr:histidine kinase [Streptomyces specialis]